MAVFHLVVKGKPVRSVDAPDKESAMARLLPLEGGRVVSAASFALDGESRTREELSDPKPRNPKLARNPQLRAFWATLTPEQKAQRTANARAGRLKRYQLMTKAERVAATAHLRQPEVYAKKMVTRRKNRPKGQKWLETYYRGGTA